MIKLELKHIAPYLPYELGLFKNNVKEELILSSLSAERMTVGVIRFYEKGAEFEKYTFDSVKPILRPLSDLTKEIEIEGNRFVPVELLKKDFFVKEIDFFNKKIGIYMQSVGHTVKPTPFFVYQKTFEWHFDIFGLIEKELAVDCNSLY
jgi:hypothetical protein